MKYGILIDKSRNRFEDRIERYAVSKYLPHTDYFIDLDDIDSFHTVDGEPVKVIMSYWWPSNKVHWPLSDTIIPKFIGLHIGDLFPSDDGSVNGDELFGLGEDCLKRFGPVGVRDQISKDFLLGRGIPAFLSGCVSLALEKKIKKKNDRKYAVIVGLNGKILKKAISFVEKKGLDVKVITDGDNVIFDSFEEEIRYVKNRLDLYCDAEFMITGSLRQAIVCIPMEIPVSAVIDMNDEDDNIDRIPYGDVISYVSREDFLKDINCLEPICPDSSNRLFLDLKMTIETEIRSFIGKNEEDIQMPLSYEEEDIALWKKNLNNRRTGRGIKRKNETDKQPRRISLAERIKGRYESVTKRLTVDPVEHIVKQVENQNLPIDNNKVFFITFQRYYTCNPKYICDALMKIAPGIECVWTVGDEDEKRLLPDGVKGVIVGSRDFFVELYTSKVWIDNAFSISRFPVKKRNGQYYIQTMHGSLGIKRLRGRLFPNIKPADEMDFIISNSAFEDDVYRSSYWRKTTILRYGHARNDILIRAYEDEEYTNDLRQRVRDHYKLDHDTKIVLYAPTFLKEDNSFNTEDELDYSMLTESLKERFGGNWAVFMRVHPRDQRKKEVQTDEHMVYDGNKWRDINELMIAADFAITDFSSWIYDYLLTRKPGLIFAPGMETYIDQTGFYYPISTTPFPVVQSNEELREQIRIFNMGEYIKNIEIFLEEKGCVDDGNASRRAAEKVLELMQK